METAFDFSAYLKNAQEDDRRKEAKERFTREMDDSGESSIVRELKAYGDIENFENLRQENLGELRPVIQRALAYYLENLGHSENTLEPEKEVVEGILSELRQKLSQLKAISEKLGEIKAREERIRKFSEKVIIGAIKEMDGKTITNLSRGEKILNPLMVEYGKDACKKIFPKAVEGLKRKSKEIEDYINSAIPELQEKIYVFWSLQDAAEAPSGLSVSRNSTTVERSTEDVDEQEEKRGLFTFSEYAQDLKTEYEKALEKGDSQVIGTLEGMIKTFISNFEVKAARFLYNRGVLRLANPESGRDVNFVESMPKFKDYEKSPLAKIIEDLRIVSEDDQDFYVHILDFIIELQRQNVRDAGIGKEKAKIICQGVIDAVNQNPSVGQARVLHKNAIMQEVDKSGIEGQVLKHLLENNANYQNIISPLK